MGSSESTMGTSSSSESRSTDTEGKVSYGVKVAAAAVTGIGLLACAAAAVSSLGSTEDKQKTMIAPGRGDRIPRKPFEDDPKTYFEDLRKK